MRESAFQRKLIKKIKAEYPGAVVLKNDPTYIQGIPDWLILHGPCWAALEVKADAYSSVRPNQSHWVEYLNRMSFASIVYPQNEVEVLHALQYALRS